MLKKSVLTIFTVFILSLFCINISYAENNSMMQNLGNTITNSIDKTEESMNNGMHKIENEISNTTEDVRNSFSNITNNMMDNSRNNDNNENTDYTAYRTSADEITGTNTMSATTWTWLIISLVAIVIVAAIWYYAVSNTDKR